MVILNKGSEHLPQTTNFQIPIYLQQEVEDYSFFQPSIMSIQIVKAWNIKD